MSRYVILISLLIASASAFAQSASERKFIRNGQSESEVFTRVGKPDHESVISGPLAPLVTKKWTYLPHPDDRDTTTTVTITAGQVQQVERKITR
jgi:hypothetical protein